MKLAIEAPKARVQIRTLPNSPAKCVSGRHLYCFRATSGCTLIGKQKRTNTMRMLLRLSIPVETGNAAAKAGTLGSTVEKILADLKPEAAYFYADDDGQRSGSIIFDMKDSSEIPGIAEPWFQSFNAKLSFRPIM